MLPRPTLRQLITAAVTTDICLVFPAISAVEAGFEVQAVLDASGSSLEIGEEMSRRRMERAGVWLTSTNTMVAELVQNWATAEGMKLVPLIAANPPLLLSSKATVVNVAEKSEPDFGRYD
jgi:hypothetical protein